MANIKITDLTAYTDPLNTDVLPIVDVTSDTTKKVSIETLLKNAATGSASAPAFAFDGDSNTGMYRSGADALAFSTGGTGRLFIDSSGNIGVGTATPTATLHVSAIDPAIFIQDANGAGAAINATIQFRDSSDTQQAYFGYASGSDSHFSLFNKFSGGDLIFGTANTERVRLDSSGRVGIGASSFDSSSRLFVYGASTDVLNDSSALWNQTNPAFIQVKNATDDITNPEAGIIFQPRNSFNGAVAVYAKRTAGYTSDLIFRFRTDASASSEVARLTSAGRLGIGTTSPGTALDVNGAAKANYAIASGPLAAYASSSGGLYSYFSSTAGTINAVTDNSGTAGVLSFATGTERARIDSSGRLLVGTSTARANFYNGSNTANILLEGLFSTTSTIAAVSNRVYTDPNNEPTFVLGRSGASSLSSNALVANGNAVGRVSFQGADGSEFVELAHIRAFVDGTPGANDMPGRLVFSTTADGASSPTERMRIDSSGRLLVGTSSSSQNIGLVIQGNSGGTDGSALFANTSSAPSGGTALGALKFSDAGQVPAVQIISRRDGGTWTSGTSHPSRLEFSTTADGASSPTERLRIDSSGNLGIGSTSPMFSNGSGVEIERSGTSTLRIEDSSGLGAVVEIFADDGEMSAIYDSRGNSSNHGHQFRVNGSEKLRIDSSGRLLVGTSSARTNFDSAFGGYASAVQVETVTAGPTGLSIYNNNASGYFPKLVLGISGGSSIGSNAIVANTNTLGIVSFQGSDGSKPVEAANIKAVVDGTPGSNDMPGRLVFSTTADGASSPTERMRITQTGYTTTYSTTSGYRFGVSAAAGTSTSLLIGSNSATGVDTGTVSFRVWSNGNVVNTNNSYGAISDIKLKENIVDASSQWDDIKDLQVRNYNFKEGQTHTQIGLIAQEVELVSPGLVSESPDRDEDGNELGTVTKSVNYSVLYMKAVKALQEAMERIEQLEQRLTDAGL